MPGQGKGQVTVTCWKEGGSGELWSSCHVQCGMVEPVAPPTLSPLTYHRGPPISSYVRCKIGTKETHLSLCAVSHLLWKLTLSLWTSAGHWRETG